MFDHFRIFLPGLFLKYDRISYFLTNHIASVTLSTLNVPSSGINQVYTIQSRKGEAYGRSINTPAKVPGLKPVSGAIFLVYLKWVFEE